MNVSLMSSNGSIQDSCTHPPCYEDTAADSGLASEDTLPISGLHPYISFFNGTCTLGGSEDTPTNADLSNVPNEDTLGPPNCDLYSRW